VERPLARLEDEQDVVVRDRLGVLAVAGVSFGHVSLARGGGW